MVVQERMEDMKIHPDGTIEGSPEELAAFKHIDAAMTRKDASASKALARQQGTPPAKPVKKAAVVKKAATIDEALQAARALDTGNGFKASQLADFMGIPVKTAYNKLYILKNKGDLILRDGTYTVPKAAGSIADAS
jgi:hypothetical protein